MNPYHLAYSQFTSQSTITEISAAYNNQFAIQGIPSNKLLNTIFNNLTQFRFDKDTKRILVHLDEQRYLEKDKESENYCLIRIIEQVVHNFKSWNWKTMLLTTMPSKHTFASLQISFLKMKMLPRMMVKLHRRTHSNLRLLGHDKDQMREIDLLTKTKYNDNTMELCSIEFKAHGTDTTTIMKQQSKNIRTNTCILNNINKESKSILYMDWREREGYLAQVFQLNDIVADLYIPKELLELDDFSITLKHLCYWRDSVVKPSNETRLAAYRYQKRYATFP